MRRRQLGEALRRRLSLALVTADGVAALDRCTIVHQARTLSKSPEGRSPELVARGESISQQVSVLFSFENCSLVALAAFVLDLSFLALPCFCGARCFQFAHPLLDSLAAKVLNQRNRDSVSGANVSQQQVAVRATRPVLERVGMQPRAPSGS